MFFHIPQMAKNLIVYKISIGQAIVLEAETLTLCLNLTRTICSCMSSSKRLEKTQSGAHTQTQVISKHQQSSLCCKATRTSLSDILKNRQTGPIKK